MATQLRQQIIIDHNVTAKMRDGTILRANVYRPAGEGRWPILLRRLPYGKDFPETHSLLNPVQVARQGYVVIVQDTRGCFASEGEWYPIRHEAMDSVDTIEWASKLDYSNGSVGMYGISYNGITQWLAAVHQPTALKAMIPLMTWKDLFNGMTFRGGALELGFLAYWSMQLGFNVLIHRHAVDPDPHVLGRAIF